MHDLAEELGLDLVPAVSAKPAALASIDLQNRHLASIDLRIKSLTEAPKVRSNNRQTRATVAAPTSVATKRPASKRAQVRNACKVCSQES